MEIRLSPEQEVLPAQLARQGDRTPDEVAQGAFADGMEAVFCKGEIRRKIAAGLEAQKPGRLVYGETVMSRIETEINTLED